MIMTAHIVNRHLDKSGLPATLSHKMLTGVLREQLQFEGLIITDDMQMKAISDYYGLEQAVTLAINAGADMFIFGNQLSEYSQDPEEIIDIIQKQVTAGLIPLEKIDAAYSRIMAFKQRMVC
jgi:beta-N-acetylhexosaminidase